MVICHQSAENMVLIQSVSDVTTVFKRSFSARRREGLILRGVEHIKDLRESVSVCVGVDEGSFAN